MNDRTWRRGALRSALTAAALTLSCALAQPGWQEIYREPFAEGAHPLYVMAGVIDFGPRTNDPWTALLRRGALEVANRTDAGVIRYYFVEPQLVPMWNERVGVPVSATVIVGGSFDELPGAGLVYGVDAATHDFVAFVLTGGDGFGVFRLDDQGYRALMTSTSSAIDPAGPNTLSVVPRGEELTLLINDEQVHAFPAAAAPGVGVGIIAAGRGVYRFDDFSIAVPPGR